ncbi:hypothetical protein Trydic_g1888 [Trypoxylus dichotomus]
MGIGIRSSNEAIKCGVAHTCIIAAEESSQDSELNLQQEQISTPATEKHSQETPAGLINGEMPQQLGVLGTNSSLSSKIA